MRRVEVYYKNNLAGHLIEHHQSQYEFSYTEDWVSNKGMPPISLTLPKTTTPYTSEYLFAFFHNMLPEGTNRKVICTHHKIDQRDYFGLLIKTAEYDTIGAVTIKEIKT